jgi:hypothetical protein
MGEYEQHLMMKSLETATILLILQGLECLKMHGQPLFFVYMLGLMDLFPDFGDASPCSHVRLLI